MIDVNYNLEDIISEQNNISNLSFFRYKCNNCQCDLISKKDINKCPICDSNVMENSDNKIDFLESLEIIPFSKNIDDAYKDYKKKVVYNPFSPFIFKRKSTFNNMKKVYLLCNLYNLKLTGSVKYAALDKCEIIKDKKKSYEKKRYEISINSNFDYNNVWGNYFNKIDDLLFDNVCSSKCDNLSRVNSNNFEDIVAIIGDLSEEEVLNKVRDRCLETSLDIIRNDIKHEIKKLIDNKLVTYLNSKRFILVPVYFLNVKHKGKDYIYLMNGENGESSSQIPLGKFEIIVFSIFIFLVIFLIAFLVAYFL